jgi:predicted RNase H-like HicB family nuclease
LGLQRSHGCDKIFSEIKMKTFVAVIEKCPDTGLYVAYVPGFPGAHTQAESLNELQGNLREVIEMLLEDGTCQALTF